MAFIKIEGFTGNIYIPETGHGRKKHPCSDCYRCAYCSDERCGLCLRKSSRKSDTPSDADNLDEA